MGANFDLDPDLLTQLNPDPIQIRNTGSVYEGPPRPPPPPFNRYPLSESSVSEDLLYKRLN